MMIHRTLLKLTSFSLLSLVGVASLSFAAGSSGGGFSGGATPAPQVSPEQRAEQAFAQGIRARDKALKQEAKAAAATSDKARNKALARAQKSFVRAVKKQTEAVRNNPQHYKAFNELGYALRNTGEYRSAIGAYNMALQLRPDFHEAIEYRGEALLTLGFYDETKNAYMTLFRDNRSLADQLMQAFDRWLEQTGEQRSEEEDAFAQWVQERKQLATVTQDLSANNLRRW